MMEHKSNKNYTNYTKYITNKLLNCNTRNYKEKTKKNKILK